MISLFLENGVAYVWNSNDWHTLRSEHRICGALIGSLSSFPRQNDFLGLPMALMSEEAALLIEKGICQLYKLPDLIERPTDTIKEEIKSLEIRTLEEQTEALKKKKIEQLSQKIDIILAGKKQKLLSKGVSDTNLNKEVLLQEEINKLPQLAPGHVLVHLPREHYYNTAKVPVGVGELNPNILEAHGVIRYSIFKDLWQQGYYITSGSKFGSDFLLYPGDPVRFHALYIVRCIYEQSAMFQPKNLVAFGRLSVSVNKLALLAFCNSYGKVEYQTLQWHDSVC